MPEMIHWLHLSDADVSKARGIIDAFKEDDTVDALGFQRISERFDDWFYPAVTTPMTRARYYLFVPTIYAHIEGQRLGYRALLDTSVKLQHELRRRLLRTEKTRHGVIGEKAGEDLRRLPSNVYWTALSALGILRRDLDGKTWGEREYQRVAGSSEPADNIVRADEDVDVEPGAPAFWDSGLPREGIFDPRGRFKERLGLRLTVPEARYLREKFILMPGGAESLVGFRLKQRLAGPYPYVWNVPTGRMPANLRAQLQHARSFSALARALSLVYYALLVEAKAPNRARSRDDDDPVAKLEGEFRFWWREGRRHVVRGWNLQAFQDAVGVDRCNQVDLRAFAEVIELVRAGRTPQDVFRSRRLRAIVTAREHEKRRNKCRLCGRPAHRRYLLQWDGPPNRWKEAFQLRYRHPAGDTITRDLLRQPYRRRSDVQD